MGKWIKALTLKRVAGIVLERTYILFVSIVNLSTLQSLQDSHHSR